MSPNARSDNLSLTFGVLDIATNFIFHSTMNALLLCAGSARRFYADGATRPKCLLQLSQTETILDRMLRQVQSFSYSAVIGTGCGHEEVCAHLEAQNYVAQTVYNADFATTNSIVTLWQMRDFIGDDTLLINGDVVVENGALELFQTLSQPQLLVKNLAQFDDDTYRVRFISGENQTHRVLDMGKELRDEPSANCAAFLGVSRVGNASRFLQEIEKLLHSGSNQTWPTTAYRAMINDIGDHQNSGVRAVDIGARAFFDIDTPEEYRQARAVFSSL